MNLRNLYRSPLALFLMMILLLSGCGGAVKTEKSELHASNEDVSNIAIISLSSIPFLIKNNLWDEKILAKTSSSLEKILVKEFADIEIISPKDEPYYSQFIESISKSDENSAKFSGFAFSKESRQKNSEIRKAEENFVSATTVKFLHLATREIRKKGISHYMIVNIPVGTETKGKITSFSLHVSLFSSKTNKIIWTYESWVEYYVPMTYEKVIKAVIDRMKLDNVKVKFVETSSLKQ